MYLPSSQWSISQSNLFICINLLHAFKERGLEHIFLCPGSRSGPLAIAAGGLAESYGLKLFTAIDERSAAFAALGISASTSNTVAVITTSGTAVANLLPAAVEADRSCHSVLFITADRPYRLKECGSNQTVNQEEFLSSVCRSVEEGPRNGVHNLNFDEIVLIVNRLWDSANDPSGPVHLNLSIEQPIHPSLKEQKVTWQLFESNLLKYKKSFSKDHQLIRNQDSFVHIPSLDPMMPGIIIAGPWRGSFSNLDSFRKALRELQKLSGWPVFADPLSGIEDTQPGLVQFWELLLSLDFASGFQSLQILRLGPMPSSRPLEKWLERLPNSKQLVISEGDFRKLDPLKKATQFNGGLVAWLKHLQNNHISPSNINHNQLNKLTKSITKLDEFVSNWLSKNILLKGQITEPSLAYWVPRILNQSIPIMLSASSPTRDWITYSGSASLSRRCFGFRGASGIDGNISLGIGISLAIGRIVLICGDLAFLHDSNSWLLTKNNNPPIIVLLIDNFGGGIFRKLSLPDIYKGDYERLFNMSQDVDVSSIASSYKIPYKQISCLEDLESGFKWSLTFDGPVLLRVCTDSNKDYHLRSEIYNSLNRDLKMSYQDTFNEIIEP